jgi:outer membrane protein
MTISGFSKRDAIQAKANKRHYSRFPKRLLVAAIVLIHCGFCGAAFGQSSSERSWDLGIAVGIGERSNPLIASENIDINTVVDFGWTGKHFYFDNGDLGYTFVERQSYEFSVVATFNNERNYYNYLTGQELGLKSIADTSFAPTVQRPSLDKTDSATAQIQISEEARNANPSLPDVVTPQFLNQNTELPDRDFALNSGFEFLYISPWGDIQAQLLSDVSSTHNGQEAWLSWSHPWYTANSEFDLTFGLEWKSANLVNYYYGVRPEESFQGRDAYAAESGTNRFIRLAARHSFAPHWNLVAMIEREFLSSAIYNSPIVNDHAVDTFFTGLFYQF